MGHINYVAVVAAAIGLFVAGFLWHGPFFGKRWAKLSGMSMEAGKAGMGKASAWALVTALVTSYVMARFVGLLAITTVGGAFWLAFWVALGFTGTTLANRSIWEKAPFELWLINAGGSLFTLFVTAAVLVLMK